MRYDRHGLLICLTTTSCEAVLPRVLIKMEKLSCKASVDGILISTEYSFNLDGTCLYQAAVGSRATNTPLAIVQQPVLLGMLPLTSGCSVRSRRGLS